MVNEQQERQLEMVAQALQQQRRSVRSYELMAAAAPERADQQLLLTMGREERRHYYLLEGIYEEIGGQAYRAQRCSLSLPKQYLAMLQVAICDKLAAIDYYEQLDQVLTCVKQRELMTIIISDQKEQARILAALYRRLPGNG